MAENPFVLIHLSDPHIHWLSKNPARYFSKRALGGANLLLRRRKKYPRARVQKLVNMLREEAWDHLIITGDVTQLGQEEEFALAREVLSPLLERGAGSVTVLPGNHDRYVAERNPAKLFEAYFGDFMPSGDPGIRQLNDHWWLAVWDSAAPAGPFSAAGEVRQETLLATESWLQGLPKHARVIIACHYPAIFPPPHSYNSNHDLLNGPAVADWLLSHPVHLYLHGHVHHNWLVEVPRGASHGAPHDSAQSNNKDGSKAKGAQENLTLVNSASTTQIPKPGQKSAFHRIELRAEGHQVFPVEF